jgi:putative transposase
MPTRLAHLPKCPDIDAQEFRAELSSSRWRWPTGRAISWSGILICCEARTPSSSSDIHSRQSRVCILPDHVHALWTLPDGDADYSKRWSLIKGRFSRGLSEPATRSSSKIIKRDKGIWQRRFWEHAIRDEDDLARHVDYIHFNPVKHGLVTRVCDWPHSTFHRYVTRNMLPQDWGGNIREIAGKFGE